MSQSQTPVPLPPHIAAAIQAGQAQSQYPGGGSNGSQPSPAVAQPPAAVSSEDHHQTPPPPAAMSATRDVILPDIPAVAGAATAAGTVDAQPPAPTPTSQLSQQQLPSLGPAPLSVPFAADANMRDAATENNNNNNTPPTPARGGNGNGTGSGGSRAESQHPPDLAGAQQQPPPMPAQQVEHGDEVRRFLNGAVIPHLMEAVKALVVQQPRPQEPVRWLAEYLAEKADQLQTESSVA